MPQRPDVLQSIWTVFQQLLRYPNRYISRMYLVYLYLDMFWLIFLIVWWNSGLATGDTKRLLRWVLLAISGGMTKPHRSWIWDSKTTGVPTMKYIISNRKLGWLHHEYAQNFTQHLSVCSQKCPLSHLLKGVLALHRDPHPVWSQDGMSTLSMASLPTLPDQQANTSLD